MVTNLHHEAKPSLLIKDLHTHTHTHTHTHRNTDINIKYTYTHKLQQDSPKNGQSIKEI